MRILGIDTCTRAGSLALVEDGSVVGALEAASGLDHSVRLLPAADFLLSRLGWEPGDLHGVAVTVGPGSFTGVRVGIATALGVARAAGLPAVGVTSLEALAESAGELPEGTWLCPWIDAGRGEVYAASFVRAGAGWAERVAPAASPPERLLAAVPAGPAFFVGDGANRYRQMLVARRGEGCVLGRGPWFLARAAARLGEQSLAGPAAARRSVEPLYLRASDAESGRGAMP